MEKQSLQLRIRIELAGARILGPGRAELLALIQSTGSIAAAGRQIGMSYKRAWILVEAMNRSYAQPLVEAMKGGAGGGGARLTPAGGEVLLAYQSLAQDCSKAAAAQLERLQKLLPPPPAPAEPPVSSGVKSG